MDKLMGEGLIGIVLGGIDSVQLDLASLRRYLATVFNLLPEKAEGPEPSLRALAGAAAELDTLLDLEAEIARKAAELPAGMHRFGPGEAGDLGARGRGRPW